MDSYLEIKKIFEGEADKENAEAMSKYMRNKFKFYGLPTPKRKELSKDFLKQEKKRAESHHLPNTRENHA